MRLLGTSVKYKFPLTSTAGPSVNLNPSATSSHGSPSISTCVSGMSWAKDVAASNIKTSKVGQRIGSMLKRFAGIANQVALTTPPLHHSTTPPLHHSTTPPLHHSISPPG